MDTTTSLLFGMLAGVMAAQGVVMLAAQREGWGNKKPGQGNLTNATLGCYRGVPFDRLETFYKQFKDLDRAAVWPACQAGINKYGEDMKKVAAERKAGKKCGKNVQPCDAAWLKEVRPCMHSQKNMCCNFAGVKDDSRKCVDKAFAGFAANADVTKPGPQPNNNPTQNSYVQQAKDRVWEQQLKESINKWNATVEAARKQAADAARANKAPNPAQKSALQKLQDQLANLKNQKFTASEWKAKEAGLKKLLDNARANHLKTPEKWSDVTYGRISDSSVNDHALCKHGDYVHKLTAWYDDNGITGLAAKCRRVSDGNEYDIFNNKPMVGSTSKKNLYFGHVQGITRVGTAGDNEIRAMQLENPSYKLTTGKGGLQSAKLQYFNCPNSTVLTGLDVGSGERVESIEYRCGPKAIA